MKWEDIFNRKRKRRGKPKDDLDRVIDLIEAFAPREHSDKRDALYYNYRILPPYPQPLLALLKTVSQKSRLQEDQSAHARELFLRLKDFYDPRNRMSREEALADVGLKRKYRELFLFFYDMREVSSQDMENWLADV